MISWLLLNLSTTALDDGAIVLGGAPVLIKGHPSVRMVAERVYIQITKGNQTVDAWFAFKNEGSARTVTMGFPDIGAGSYATEQYEKDDEAKRKRRKSPNFEMLSGFRSWLDGEEVRTRLVRGDDPAESFHVKTVRFTRNGWRNVHVSYTCPLGVGATNSGGYIYEASYILHTGSSWKGSIGSVTVTFDFKNGQPRPYDLRKVPESLASGYESRNWRASPKNRMLFVGFSNPFVKGSTVTFRGRNVEPDELDDARLYFGFRKTIPEATAP